MNRTFKIYIASLILINTCVLSYTQEKAHLPYSVFGIGELNPTGFNRNMALGKTGIGYSSGNGLNNVNPASYHSIDSISFFFDVGVSGSIVKYKNSIESQNANDGNLSNLAIGFPIARWWKSSVGLTPFSTVGYKVDTEKNVEGTIDNFDVAMKGFGGLNKFYWGNSISLYKKIHLGFNLNYVFGTIEKYEFSQYSGFSGTIYTKETSYLSKLTADFGLQLDIIDMEKIDFTLGGTYGYKTPLYFQKDLKITDENSSTLQDETTYIGKFTLPDNYGIGFSLQLFDKLMLTGDYSYYNWSQTESNSSDYKYVDTENLRFGIEFTPSIRGRSNYLEKITYRAGCYLDDYYLKINGVTNQDYGITGGLSLPLVKNKSSINLSYVRGQFGTTNNSLIEKKYNSFYVSFTLHDWWFIRSKFD